MTRRSAETRERLFSAAAELIGERGFHGTSVDDIVERAGVAKGTVYYHFKSKEALFDALLTEHFTRLGDEFRRVAEEASSPPEALRALVHAELDYIVRYRAASKLLMSELWRADRAWQDTLRLLRERYAAVLASVIADGVASGDFRADLDTGLTSSAIFGVVATMALDWLVFAPDRAMAEVEQAAASLVLRSVTA